MQLPFFKAQGTGNDYIYLDCRTGHTPLPGDLPALARDLSRRRYAVGADGIIVLAPPLLCDADATMRIFNADGSEGEMCGNGVRCAAEYLYCSAPQAERKTTYQIDTLKAGRKSVKRLGAGVWQAGMGRFSAQAAALPAVGLGPGPLTRVSLVAAGQTWQVACISMGNPHCVVEWGPDAPPTGRMLAQLGPLFEKHPAFPKGINTEFVQRRSPNRLCVTVWERGSGATLSCGTGACAAVAAMVLRGHCRRGQAVRVSLPGGELGVTVQRDDTVLLAGAAKIVYSGTVEV